ncbi:MAG: efflux RND transporter periplasmic adaptor subunit [Betaproteobacteria bacterium]
MNADSRQAYPSRPAFAQDGQAWVGLAQFDGPLPLFWERYLQAVGQPLQARRVLLLASGVGLPWKALAQWPADAPEAAGDAADVLQTLAALPELQARLEPLAGGGQLLAMRLPQAPAPQTQVLALVALHASVFEPAPQALLHWAEQAAAVPAQYARRAMAAALPAGQQQSSVQPGESPTGAAAPARLDLAGPAAQLADEPHAQRLYQILRLSIELSRQPRFLQRAFELCNALAVRFDADRVSLGWMRAPYVRLTAISHVEKFDRLSAISRALEGAMEEAADQGQALVYPAEPGVRQVQRAHESYALMQGVAAVASVPLIDGDQVVGVISLEKMQGRWSADELWELGLIAQTCALPLSQLHESDRWFGARWWGALKGRRGAPPRHSAWKLAGVLGLVGLVSLFFIPWDYRIDARLTLRSKDLVFVSAPFDSYLRQVHVDMGDKVKAGQVLMQLDTRELVLEESMAQADVLRYSREAEKAQALRQLAEMQITMARRDQSASRLALIRHQLANAKVTAPQDGVVVEGELKKNLGAPLRKGDLLLKLAQTEDSYLELEIDQADVHEVQVGSRGQFALVGRPEQRYAIEIDRIDPASTLREGKNVYLARGRLQEGIAPWWRPGMGGTARIEAGERPLIWVMTHRTVRFLREFFWL